MSSSSSGLVLSFALACSLLASSNVKLSSADQLRAYALYKQATNGPLDTTKHKKPSTFEMVAKAKWSAWQSLGSMSVLDAESSYIDFVKSKIPIPNSILNGGSSMLINQHLAVDDDDDDDDDEEEEEEEEEEKNANRKAKGGFSLTAPQSTMNSNENTDDRPQDTVFAFCRLGKFEELQANVNKDNINDVDEEGNALLHYACDRGDVKIVNWLIANGADILKQDECGMSCLHYACLCGDEIEFVPEADYEYFAPRPTSSSASSSSSSSSSSSPSSSSSSTSLSSRSLSSLSLISCLLSASLSSILPISSSCSSSSSSSSSPSSSASSSSFSSPSPSPSPSVVSVWRLVDVDGLTAVESIREDKPLLAMWISRNIEKIQRELHI